MVFGQVMEKLPGAQAIPRPSLDLGNPEVRVKTHRRRAAELGLSNRELGYAVSALVDGAKASDYQYEGKEIDIRLMAEEGCAHRTHLLEQMPIATPDGDLVTLGSVAEVSRGQRSGADQPPRAPAHDHDPGHARRGDAARARRWASSTSEILQPMRDAGQLGGCTGCS